MARALGSKAQAADLKRLTGGLEGETFAFRVRSDHFVVKIYVEDDGEQAKTEFDNLDVVSTATVPTPEPVLMDQDGEWFQAPAIVMSALPGRPDMHPTDRGLWIEDAAEALASVHAIPCGRASDVKIPRWQRWKPSTEGMGTDSKRASSALDLLYDQAPTLPTVLSHDDYNPGNLLFDDGHLSGVVDWADIAVEPRQAAVALFRHFLAIHPGGDTPDEFLQAYEEAAEISLDDLPLWDVLLWTTRCLPS